MLPIEKVRSYCITLGITEVILVGSMLYFSPGNKLQTSILTLQSVLLPCFRQQIKGEQSDEIRHSSLINSKPHEVKSTDMHCILTTNINKCRGEKTTRTKECQIFASAMFPASKPAYLQKVDSKWDKPCDFFRSPLRAS